MKSLLCIAVSLAVATAKPELYRESEDFQYARSSSDDGSKSGYYGAQRGNMGGNYERAHNMDNLAQNQMSGLVRQVEGELGDGSNTRTGSVYTAANSRGIYGSGRYDLSNLQGRNFQEGASYGNSQSRASQSSHTSAGQSASSSHSSGYSNSQSHNSRYQTKNSGQAEQSSNLETESAGTSNYGRHAGYNAGYHSQSGYQGIYGSQGYGSNAQTRLISGAPARVVIRPGGTVFIPIAAQSYDTSHGASSFDQNAINSEAEVLNNNQHTHYPTSSVSSGDAKSYESSYSYRKQWEKHNTQPGAVPLAIPTANPYPKNSELYDDTQSSHTSSANHDANEYDSHNSHSSNVYNSNVKSALSRQSRYNGRSGYNSQHSSALSDSNDNSASNSNTHGTGADASSPTGGVNSRPKSYQSSYSYHKSWERQGDPYVIIPDSTSANDGQTSQRLTAESNRQGHQSHQYGHHSHTHGSSVDCDENGHIRVARSYNTARIQEVDPYQQSQTFNTQESVGQQEQTGWENLEDLQQTQDLSQQTQTNWNDQRQSGFEHLEDLGQQTQTNWDQTNFQNLEELGQQSQNPWDKTEDIGHQTQTDLDQQTQDIWDKYDDTRREKLKGQQPETKWDNLEDLEQQVQGPWHGVHQKEQSSEDKEIGHHETQEGFESQYGFNQYSEGSQHVNEGKYDSNHDHTISDLQIWDRLDGDLQSLNTDDKVQKPGQNIHRLNQNNQIEGDEYSGNFEQQNNWNQFSQEQSDNLDQQKQNAWDNHNTLNHNKVINDNDQVKSIWEQSEDNTQQISTNGSEFYKYPGYGKIWNTDRHEQNNNVTQESESNYNWNMNNSFSNNTQTNSGSDSSLQSLWDKINNLEQTYTLTNNNTNTNDKVHTSSHGVTGSQNYNQNSGSHTYETNSGSDQSNNEHNSQHGGYQPRQVFHYENTSTAEESKVDEELGHHIENLRPYDIGRGDIGAEDSISLTTTTTDETYHQSHNVHFSPSFTVDSENKQYKSQDEIEALSLMKESNKTANVDNTNLHKQLNIDGNTQLSESNLNVLGLNQQKWLDEQRQKSETLDAILHTTSSTTPKSIENHFNTNFQQIHESTQRASQQFNNYSHSGSNVIYNSNTIYDSQQLPNGKDEDEQGNVSVEQGPDVIEQQNTEQQFEDFGLFGQQNEKLNQQTQNGWGQQTHNSWEETQGAFQQERDGQEFDKLNQGQYQTHNFYNQKYLNKEERESSPKIGDTQNIAETSETDGKIETIPAKNVDYEFISPPEITKEKPGFWKSVGNKFTNAKDTVASWFRSR